MVKYSDLRYGYLNRGADQRRGRRKQALLDCVVHGVWSSSLFWRVATAKELDEVSTAIHGGEVAMNYLAHSQA